MVVSLVIAGGLIAAFAGAAIVNLTIGFFPEARYASCFFAAAILQILSLSVILSLKTPPLIREVHKGRPLSAFFKIPRFVAGLVAASLGYAVMSFMMTAAPLQIVTVSNLTDADNAAVIQWHVVAMFAPSFFTGVLIKRFGADSIIGMGLVFYLIAVVVLFWRDFFLALSYYASHGGIWLERSLCDGLGGDCCFGDPKRTPQSARRQRLHYHNRNRYLIAFSGLGALFGWLASCWFRGADSGRGD